MNLTIETLSILVVCSFTGGGFHWVATKLHAGPWLSFTAGAFGAHLAFVLVGWHA